MTQSDKVKRDVSNLLWGRLALQEKRMHSAALAFAVSAIVSMSFTQLGFWCAGTVDDQQLYLMPLLAPIVCSTFAFGPLTGALLGLFEGIPYKKLTRQMNTGDMLYLYTDGVTEAMNTDNKLFGEERLEQTLYRYADMNPRSVGVGVRRAITDFTLDCDQSDDITMLILKYGVAPEPLAVMILPALDDQLIHVHNFINEELHRRNAPKAVYNPLDIAAEELFVNVCHYAYPQATPDNPGEVRIGFEYEVNPPSLTVTISDDGVPYNPLEKPDAVTPGNIADVPIGGLGILMAKRSVDSMSYERVGTSNVLTFKKSW